MKHFYGYMVGYRSPAWVCQFKAYTKAQAKRALAYYRRYSNTALRPLHWSIQPITRKQYKDRIWEELPFNIKSNLFIA